VDDHAPVPPHVRETIELWVSDFLDRPQGQEAATRVGPNAPAILASFLDAACHGGKEPGDVEETDVAHALLDHVASLQLPSPARDAVPELVARFLADLQDVGRLSGGRTLAAQVRAAAPAFRTRAAGRPPSLDRPAPKIGRNDPCPCGSGRKYKQCCLRTLGG
jgi:hypothetical protein